MKIQCPLCGGETVRKKVDHEYRKNGQYIVIKNVPAYVCQDCGETLFDSSVVKKLLSGSLLEQGKEVGCLKKIEVGYPG